MSKNVDIEVVRDPIDLRDQIYAPSLQPLRALLSPEDIVTTALSEGQPLPWLPRDQGREGTCTGQALAALIDLQQLIHRESDRLRKTLIEGKSVTEALADFSCVSARMLYAMARQQEKNGARVAADAARKARTQGKQSPKDPPGSGANRSSSGPVEGATLRAVIKGFYHHGVCSDRSWQYVAGDPGGDINVLRAKEARKKSLGAYFRLRPSLNDYHCALNEAGPVIVSASIHAGWSKEEVAKNEGKIIPSLDERGGHAFLIVGYTDEGFLILNSWGPEWGGYGKMRGVALWSYQDWADTIMDGWVLRLGVSAPAAFDLTIGEQGVRFMQTSVQSGSTPAHETLGHMAHLDDGLEVTTGPYAYTRESLSETCSYLKQSSGKPADEREYKGIFLRLSGSLLGLKDATRQIAEDKLACKQHKLYPYTIIWCADFVERTTAVLGTIFDDAFKQVGIRGEELDELIEERVQGVGRAFWRDVARAAMRSAYGDEFWSRRDTKKPRTCGPAADILNHFAALDGYDLHIVADGAGILLLNEVFSCLGTYFPEHRARLLDRIASLDMITPTIDRDGFETGLGSLVEALAKKPSATPRCMLHVPDAVTEKRLSVGHYSKSILELIENAFNDRKLDGASGLPSGHTLIGRAAAATGLRRTWSRRAPFKTVGINEIHVNASPFDIVEQRHLQSETRLLKEILDRISPLPQKP